MFKTLAFASASILLLGCSNLILASENKSMIRSSRSIGHLKDYFNFGAKQKVDLKIQPSSLNAPHKILYPSMPIWKIHKYSGMHIKPVSSIPFFHIANSKPEPSKVDLPSLERIQSLLGTNTASETIDTLKDLASSEDGLKLMASFIKAEYPHLDFSENDIVSAITQYEIKSSTDKKEPPRINKKLSPHYKKSPSQEQISLPPHDLNKALHPANYYIQVESPQKNKPSIHPWMSALVKPFHHLDKLKETLTTSHSVIFSGQSPAHLYANTVTQYKPYFKPSKPKNLIPLEKYKNPLQKSSKKYNFPDQGYSKHYESPLQQAVKQSIPQSPLIQFGPPPQALMNQYRTQSQLLSKQLSPSSKASSKQYAPPTYTLLNLHGPPSQIPSKQYDFPPQTPLKQYGSPLRSPSKQYDHLPQVPSKQYGPLPQVLLKQYGHPLQAPLKQYGPPTQAPSNHYGPPPILQNYKATSKLTDSYMLLPLSQYHGEQQDNALNKYNIEQKPYDAPKYEPKPLNENKPPQLFQQNFFTQNYESPDRIFYPFKLISDIDNTNNQNFLSTEIKQNTSDSMFTVKAKPIIVLESQNFDHQLLNEIEPTIESLADLVQGTVSDDEGQTLELEKGQELVVKNETEQEMLSIENDTIISPTHESSESSIDMIHENKEQKYIEPQSTNGGEEKNSLTNESVGLETQENYDLFEKESNNSKHKLKSPQITSQSSDEISTDAKKEYSNENSQTFTQIDFDSLSKWHQMNQQYGLPNNEKLNLKPNVEYVTPIYYSYSYPGVEPTSTETLEKPKIDPSFSPSLESPGSLPFPFSSNVYKLNDFESGIQNLNNGKNDLLPEIIINSIWKEPAISRLASKSSDKYQFQQSSFVPMHEPNKFMVEVQQEFFNNNIKPSNSGDVKITQETLNTNGRQVNALKYEHPNFSYTQLSPIPDVDDSDSKFSQLSEIPLQNTSNFENSSDKVSSYGTSLSPTIFNINNLPAASEMKISTVIPENKQKAGITDENKSNTSQGN